MASSIENLPELLRDIPAGDWVAISEQNQQVLAYDPDAQVVLNEARTQGVEQPLIIRKPDTAGMTYI